MNEAEALLCASASLQNLQPNNTYVRAPSMTARLQSIVHSITQTHAHRVVVQARRGVPDWQPGPHPWLTSMQGPRESAARPSTSFSPKCMEAKLHGDMWTRQVHGEHAHQATRGTDLLGRQLEAAAGGELGRDELRDVLARPGRAHALAGAHLVALVDDEEQALAQARDQLRVDVLPGVERSSRQTCMRALTPMQSCCMLAWSQPCQCDAMQGGIGPFVGPFVSKAMQVRITSQSPCLNVDTKLCSLHDGV